MSGINGVFGLAHFFELGNNDYPCRLKYHVYKLTCRYCPTDHPDQFYDPEKRLKEPAFDGLINERQLGSYMLTISI